ncbi:MAG: thiol-disulfide isomerase/thioredoxin [Phycisphaerales bacterium]|jgi:thiol-disulfide isomerase/thioredoxin
MLRAARLVLLGLLTLPITGCATPIPQGRYLLDLRTGAPGATNVEVALDLTKDRRGRWQATLVNGPEHIVVPRVTPTEDGFILDIPHYDSFLDLSFEYRHKAWSILGSWVKDRGDRNPAVVTVEGQPIINQGRTRRGPIHINDELTDKTTGRYALDFDESGAAILDLLINRDGTASATVLTPTGDYRFLEGRLDPRLPRRDPESKFRADTRPPGALYLSTFDGAHMFALTGTLNDDGSIDGYFFSGNWWVEVFTAIPDESATLPDAFAETTYTDDTPLDQLIYTNLDGEPESVADLIRRAHEDNPNANKNGTGPDGMGPTIVEVFGSWCPNCHDAADYLAELQETHRDRGLRVVGLAFELTDDLNRSINQVRLYQQRHGAQWPVLVAGLSDKALATEALPVLDRIRSFPTAIFIDASGTVRGVHTGFTGPATGDEYLQMRAEYDAVIEAMLSEQ